MNDLFKNIVWDVRIELTEEFDQNFQRKAFFTKPWDKTDWPNSRGSLLMRSGQLRRGNRSMIQGTNIVFTNSQPYAALHNDGGAITITPKMIRFFWAMYYKSGGAATRAGGKRKQALAAEAQRWKSLAIKKPGDLLHIKQRQFIGWHPSLKKHIERVVEQNMKETEAYITNLLKSKK